MANHTFNQLVDITQVRQLLESHHTLSGMAYGLFDTDETCLIAVGWQDICTRFHRINPVSQARCRESDAYIARHLGDFDGDYLEYNCQNGMIDVAMPIIIDGEHLATFFTGQFFYDDDMPDVAYFRAQAEALGFCVGDYIEALERVPIFSREHIRGNLIFLHSVVQVLAENGLNSFRLACEMEERKRTELRLALTGFALNSVREAAFLIDEYAQISYVNDEACRSLGYNRQELLNLSVADLDPDWPVDRWQEHWDFFKEHRSKTVETRHRAKDGRVFPVEVTASYLEYEGYAYNLALVRDITERKRAEQERLVHLRFLEGLDRVNRAMQGTNDLEQLMTDVLDTLLAIFDCDRAWVYSCDSKAVIWRSFMERTRPEYPGAFALGLEIAVEPDVKNTFKLLMANCGPVTFGPGSDLPLQTGLAERFGIRSMIAMAIYPMSDKPFVFGLHQCSCPRVWSLNEKTLLQEIGRRLTDGLTGLLAYRNLQESERKFRTLAVNLPDTVGRYDRQGRILYLNPSVERVLQRPLTELVGKRSTEAYPDGVFDDLEKAILRVATTGDVERVEVILPGEDGANIVMVHLAAEREVGGEITGVLAIGRDITERKQMETALRESEQRFRDIFEHSQDALYLLEVTKEGRFRNLEVNAALERSVGMSRTDLIGRYVDETTTEETAATVTAKYRRCLEAGTVIEEEVELELPSGRRFFYSTLVPVRDDTGRIHRIVGITRDITRRKQAEQKLRKALDFSEGVINAVPDLLFELDREGRYLNVWTQKPELLSARKEILLEKTVHDVLSPESAAIVIHSIREAEEQGLSFGNILQNDLPQGPCWFELSVSRKPGGVAADVTFIVLSRDITGRKRMEVALAEREKEFRTLAENAPDVIVRYDRECRRIYVNPAFERVNRLSPQEALGKSPIELSTELAPLAVDFTQYLKAVLETGVATQLDIVAAKDGIDSSWFVRLIPESDSSGEVVSALTIWTDITERKRLETALRQSEQQFRTLAENSPNIIVRYDRDCRRTFVNPAYVRETGIAAELAQNATPGTVWSDVNMPANKYCKLLEKVMETGDPMEIVLELRCLGTECITSHAFHVVPERNSEADIIGCLAIGHNITALKEAELRLGKLSASVPGFLYTYRLRPDGTACMPYASPQIKDIYGFAPEAVTEDASETLARIHPDDVSRVRESIAESARNLFLWQAEFRIRHPEEGDIWVEGRSMPEAQPDGGIVWFGLVHDITKRKRIEESLRIKREQLAAMTLELSLAEERERLRIASELHDHIGQTLLLGRIKLGTLAYLEVSEPVRKTIDEVRDLLDQATNDAHSLAVQLNPPVLAAAGLEAALEWLGRRMEADYGLRVEFLDDKRPKPLSEELRSIVYQGGRELLINAAKHAKSDRARLFVAREEEMYLLAVEDDGAGFDPAALVPDRSKDCRFGLFSTQVKIERFGGKVTIDSAPGRGSRIEIRMPLATR